MSKRKLGELDFHELLDRTALMANNLETYLLNHQAIDNDKEIKKHIEKATTHLYQAYQLLGEKHL